MVDWYPVTSSSRIVAEAYLADREIILVRFPNGAVWAYRNCSLADWHAFTAPGQSRGKFIATVLDKKPNGLWTA